jgi:hypothetical protein
MSLRPSFSTEHSVFQITSIVSVCSEYQTGHKNLERRELLLYKEYIIVNNYNI